MERDRTTPALRSHGAASVASAARRVCCLSRGGARSGAAGRVQPPDRARRGMCRALGRVRQPISYSRSRSQRCRLRLSHQFVSQRIGGGGVGARLRYTVSVAPSQGRVAHDWARLLCAAAALPVSESAAMVAASAGAVSVGPQPNLERGRGIAPSRRSARTSGGTRCGEPAPASTTDIGVYVGVPHARTPSAGVQWRPHHVLVEVWSAPSFVLRCAGESSFYS